MNADKLKETVQLGILDSILLKEESLAAKTAKSMGMHYVGFGRWSDGKDTYKSDGDHLVPLDGKKSDSGKPKENFLQKFIRQCNETAERTKSGKALLKAMLKMLPGKEKGEQYGNVQVLEQILNSAMPHFNKYVMTALKSKKFRNHLLKKYLDKFEKQSPDREILPNAPAMPSDKNNDFVGNISPKF